MASSFRSLVPALVLALGLSGCSGNVCKKWEKEFEDCDGDDFDSVEQCEEQLSACDSDDEKLIDDFFQCMKDEGLFECDAEFDTADIAALVACSEDMGDLSAECQASFSGTAPTS